jgi:hypothetical protein
MQKAKAFLTVLFINLFPTVLCYAESLTIIDEMTLSADKAAYGSKEHGRLHVSGVYLEGETTFAATNAGLLAKFSRKGSWRKILDREPIGNNTWEDFKTAKNKNALFSPGHLWRITSTDEIVVFDNYISLIYTINLRNRDKIKARLWKDPDEKSHVSTVSIYNDLILYGISSGFHDSILAVSRPDMSDYHRVFECPSALKQRLDSVWADPTCIPAFNHIDSTIWLAFDYYNYAYIVDTNGRLLDSIEIAASDFRMPQPPRSRMHSNAVFRDWASKCTPVNSFWYVPPGYFLLQYRSGWRGLETDSIPLRSTLAWRAGRRPVDLDVDKNWRLVGVQPDGRVIFAGYVIDDNKFRETILYVTRIEP